MFVKTANRLTFCFALLALAACAPEVRQADLILVSGKVYTLNDAQPWAEAVAIREGRIVAVGSNDTVTGAWRGPAFDLTGQMVLPGFHDAHVHPIFGGIQMTQCDLAGLASVETLLDKVRQCDQELFPEEWLLGGGWNLALFPEANPNKALLDEINATRPMFLRGEDGHSSWANSTALQLAGIESETPNPSHGIIERDEHGEPSGTLRESAQTLIENIVPVLTLEQRVEATRAALRFANELGITSMVDASVSDWELQTYRALETQGGLTARLVLSATIGENPVGGSNPEIIAPDDRGSGKRLRLDAAKIFVDGVLEGETAALLEPYIDRGANPGHGAVGMLLTQPDTLNETVANLDAKGVQVHFHAIGDRAVRAALDAVEHARRVNGGLELVAGNDAGDDLDPAERSGYAQDPLDNRHHVSHLQLIDEQDHARFAQLGVLANFQALWAYPDGYIMDINLPAVGRERVERMYPLGSIERAGGVIVGGSDWSVSSLNPLDAIETAVTREDASGVIEGVLNPNERVSLATMLAAYTKNGAYLMHQEDEVGTIEPGKLADLVVLDRNLFDISTAEISDVEVTMTLLGGEKVFVRGSAD